MRDFTIVCCGIDTLECTFAGELSEELVERLNEGKQRAQLASAPIPFFVGQEEMFILPKARGMYLYVLQRGDLVIQLTQSSAIPTAFVRLGAFGLATEGPEALYGQAERLCGQLGATLPYSLSRIDVAVDFQGFEPTHDNLRGMVCSATKRREFFGGERLETASYGKRPLMLRLYDKTQQAREEHKEWWHEVWAAANPAYDPAQRVVRVEVEITRTILRQLGVLSVRSALDNPGRLLDFGMRWCELRVPTEDGTKARWPVDPRWERLRQAVYTGEPVNRARLKAALMGDEAVQKRLIGAVATHAARWGFDSYWEALKSLSMDAERYLEAEGLDFAAEIEKRRRRLLTS